MMDTASEKPRGYDDPNVLQLGAKEGDSHPEREDDETFVGYRNGSMCGLPAGKDGRTPRTRKGVMVIDDYGRDRTQDARGEFFPVFMNTEELTDSRQ